MSQRDYYGFDTLSLHAGATPDRETGARATPIYLSSAFVFRDSDHAAALFNMEQSGHVYSRISNPTVAVLEERIAALEQGVGAIATASGQASTANPAITPRSTPIKPNSGQVPGATAHAGQRAFQRGNSRLPANHSA